MAELSGMSNAMLVRTRIGSQPEEAHHIVAG